MNGIMGCESRHRLRNLDSTSVPLGEFYHVIVRGDQRQKIFRDDQHRRYFRERVERYYQR